MYQPRGKKTEWAAGTGNTATGGRWRLSAFRDRKHGGKRGHGRKKKGDPDKETMSKEASDNNNPYYGKNGPCQGTCEGGMQGAGESVPGRCEPLKRILPGGGRGGFLPAGGKGVCGGLTLQEIGGIWRKIVIKDQTDRMRELKGGGDVPDLRGKGIRTESVRWGSVLLEFTGKEGKGLNPTEGRGGKLSWGGGGGGGGGGSS